MGSRSWGILRVSPANERTSSHREGAGSQLAADLAGTPSPLRVTSTSVRCGRDSSCEL
jgi:hypothetical protein